MAKAHITLPDGIAINVEGTAAEITSIVERLKGAETTARDLQSSRGKKTAKATKERRQRVQLVDLVANLIDGGFFKKPKDLATVKSALAEMGHHYPVTSLSGTMLTQVRKRNLRRIRQGKRWMYTG